MATSSEELPEIMQVVADFMTEALIKKGISESVAADLGVECCMAVMKAVGGDSYYIPKGVKLTYTKRDLQIYNEFFNTPLRQLSAKYGITTRRIYQIVAAVRLGEEVPEQLNLFDAKDFERTGGVNGK